MNRNFLENFKRNYIKEKKEKLLAEGKISWLDPEKIEKQSILNSLIEARGHIKGRLLDIGCADKPYEVIFKDRFKKYIGIDLPIAAEVHKKIYRVDIYASVLELPCKLESFDTILSTQVLEHLPEPRMSLQEAFRVLKKGGYLILTAPMVWELHETPFDYYRFTKYGLINLAEGAGFKIIYIKARGGIWAVVGQRLSSIVYRLRGEPKSIITMAIKVLFCVVIQALFLILDKVNKDERETLGYIMVAQK
ncbi:MAG: methyltransferase domain-containing protein [Candidatus Omnitrophota bacterium]